MVIDTSAILKTAGNNPCGGNVVVSGGHDCRSMSAEPKPIRKTSESGATVPPIVRWKFKGHGTALALGRPLVESSAP